MRWIVLWLTACLVVLVYDAHAENRGLRQLITDELGLTSTDMRWQECAAAKKAICN